MHLTADTRAELLQAATKDPERWQPVLRTCSQVGYHNQMLNNLWCCHGTGYVLASDAETVAALLGIIQSVELIRVPGTNDDDLSWMTEDEFVEWMDTVEWGYQASVDLPDGSSGKRISTTPGDALARAVLAAKGGE